MTIAENRAYQRDWMRKWRANKRASDPSWNERVREKEKLAKRLRYKANPEKYRSQKRAWRNRNLERVRASQRDWCCKRPGYYARIRKLRKERFPEKYLAAQISRRPYQAKWAREWRRNNRARAALHHHNHRIKRKSAPSNKDANLSVVAIRSKKAGKCFYCGKRRKLTVEHITPLSAGGHHAAFNIVGACDNCNKSKHTKSVNEFIRNGQLVIEFKSYEK